MTPPPPDFLMRVPPLKLHVRNATQTNGEPAVVRQLGEAFLGSRV
jgi:hypothetical protein